MDQSMVLIIGVIAFIAFNFLLTRKQREKAKEAQNMLNSLKPGDHVVTVGGLHGVIDEVADTTVVIDCEGVFLTFERRAIHHVVPASEQAVTVAEDSSSEE